jgi:outer membrane protein OmpA-like peptidoglycan-associated protein
MKSFIISILSVLLLITVSTADETGGKFKLGIRGGGSSYWGDIDDQPFGFYYGGSVDYWGSNYLGIGTTFGQGFISAENDNYYFKSKIWIYNLLFRIKPWPSFVLNPQLILGFDGYYFDPKDNRGWSLVNNRLEKYDKWQYAVPVGGGIAVFLNEYISLDAEALYHITFTDYIDDLKKGNKNDGILTVSGGISVYFGKAKDSDKDGIPDKKDKEPRLPEDFDGFEDEDGAPEVDNDGDGIHDSYDKAPMEAEDFDGFQDKDGVPDLDNDDDGILDEKDACPGTDATVANGIDTEEDFDGFEDSDGCPDEDNDKDGIPDTKDQCPEQAENFNNFQDEDGCPDEKDAMAMDKGQALILEGVNFASGSATLTTNAKRILDKAVEILIKNPQMELEIRGYTDNTGSYNGNVNISRRRAESVKAYLVLNGIFPTRLTTKGLGPENPIAPNTTAEGRAKNRRIEFYRVK